MVRQLIRRPKAAPWGAAVVVLTAAALAASAGVQRAAETAPPLPTKRLTTRDLQLSVHARKALAADKELAAANLGVRVQDNVAVLWGPAPSEELKRRAVETVKKIKGIFEVRAGDVYIAPAGPAEAPALSAAAPEAVTHTEAASPPEPTGALTGRPAAEPTPPTGVVLRAPLPVGDAGPAHTVSAAPPAEGLAAALEQLRQGDERFRRVDCRLAGDVVTLRPGAASGEDVMAFARAISRLPGLTRVIVETEGDGPR